MGYSTTHFKSINPYTEETVYEAPMHSRDEALQMVERANEAYEKRWRESSFKERATLLQNTAKELRENMEEYALAMTDEMGKPIKEARGEVEKAAWCAEHYAAHGEAYLQKEHLDSDASSSYVQYMPLGPTLGILPWNAPFWLAFRYLAPALMSGNTCIMKHDSHTPLCAKLILRSFERGGAPEDVVQNLMLDHTHIEYIIRHPHIKGVSLTGSANAGAIVGGIAGREIKPVVLELGGSDPAIVLNDVKDMEHAADIIALSRYINAGQSCIAAKRIIVEEGVYEEFIELLKQRFEKLRLGNPREEQTDIGPIARKNLVEEMHQQVDRSIEAGARLVLGGERHEGKGYFFPVTMLADVEPGMVVSCQETFGPIAAVIKAKDADDALKIANDTEYGLGAAIWSGDSERAVEMAGKIVAGQVAINGIVKTDPRLPSGGVKRSGLGRELGPQGIKMFVNTQQIWVGPKKE